MANAHKGEMKTMTFFDKVIVALLILGVIAPVAYCGIWYFTEHVVQRPVWQHIADGAKPSITGGVEGVDYVTYGRGKGWTGNTDYVISIISQKPMVITGGQYDMSVDLPPDETAHITMDSVVGLLNVRTGDAVVNLRSNAYLTDFSVGTTSMKFTREELDDAKSGYTSVYASADGMRLAGRLLRNLGNRGECQRQHVSIIGNGNNLHYDDMELYRAELTVDGVIMQTTPKTSGVASYLEVSDDHYSGDAIMDSTSRVRLVNHAGLRFDGTMAWSWCPFVFGYVGRVRVYDNPDANADYWSRYNAKWRKDAFDNIIVDGSSTVWHRTGVLSGWTDAMPHVL